MKITSFEHYLEVYKQSIDSPEKFWNNIALHFEWKKKWSNVLEWNFAEPNVKWFLNAELNITENCLDRHVRSNPNKLALVWEPNNPNEESRKYTYNELFIEVCRFSTALRKIGIKKGDRVCIYMGMVPELTIAMLACARIGAIHSIVFGGFSAQSLTDRIYDANAEFIITCDGAYRGDKVIPLKNIVDDAVQDISFVKKIITLVHTNNEVNWNDRDVNWKELTDSISQINYDAEVMNSEDPLFILYTSGSTGKPKGVVHSCGGYMVYTAYTFLNVFDYQENQIHFCTADIGWITGHSYIVYGPLLNGATSLMFEGIPTWPSPGRFWDIVEKYNVNILYTAPTAIRSLMTFGLEPFEGKNLSSLKVLGTVGEPINEEAWHWYNEHIGKKQCPIVDTWWQTETGGILISNLAHITNGIPCYATLPLPGVQPILVDESGKEITENNTNGNLCIRFPWPSMLRTTYGDHERCRLNYFSIYPNLYFTGDGAFRDENGNYRIIGRVDDVLNVSGHRIGTAELENAINENEFVIESAVVGYPHDIKGQGIYAYIIINVSNLNNGEIEKSVLKTVTEKIGSIAKPDKIQVVKGLPKTRSGKIMRRILRKIAENNFANLGDTTTLLDPSLIEDIIINRVH